MSKTYTLSAVTAYGLAVAAGYTGTESEWLASLKGSQGEGIKGVVFNADGTIQVTVHDPETNTDKVIQAGNALTADLLQQIVGCKVTAETSASDAHSSATAAAGSATSANSSKESAAASANTASTASSVATQKAEAASDSAESAASSASAAYTSRTNIESHEANTLEYKNSAAASANAASTSEINAASSEQAAAASASSAAASQAEAAASAASAAAADHDMQVQIDVAAASAAAAQTSEINSAASAAQASTSEDNAASSASTATSKAQAASVQASSADTSAKAAASSASAAQTSEQNAFGYATAASTSEINAANSASAASTSETNASQSAISAAASAVQCQEISQLSKGYYPTSAALIAAWPVGQSGWWAIDGATDSIWVWDVEGSAWVDTHKQTDLSDYYTKGQVDTRVNAKADVNHSSTTASYGAANETNYGHVKLSDSTSSASSAQSGIAASPAAVKAAFDKGSSASTVATVAQTTANANKAAIGTLANLATTAKSDIVSSINEVKAALANAGVQMVKLWENASPTSNFAAQTVSLNLTDYAGVEIVYYGYNQYVVNSGFIPKGACCFSFITWTPSATYGRSATTNDAGVDFSVGGTNNSSINNSACRPYQIYGIKGVTSNV